MNASGKTTKTLVWILMGMLILGLGGFGVTNLGGSVRTIGSVGDKPITTQSYSRALQQMLRGQVSASGGAMSFAEAQSQQLDRLVLSQLIAARSLDSEAAQLGLSVGDERLAAQILSTDAFRGVNGEFNRDDYRFRLQQIGLTEREFEICTRIAPVLCEKGLIFTGIDVIDGWLTEINVTSPTGIQELERFDGINAAEAIWEAIERRVAAKG